MATIMGHVPPLSVDSGGGHSNSPLFTSLPVEIRLQIYDEVFTGSKLTLVITPSRHSRDPVPLGGRRTIFESTGHHNFLLTCRVVYHEALSSYWSKTLVVCGTSERLANFLGLETGDLFHLTYVANRMSDFAKAHIKHLREVEPFKDPVYQDTHDLPFREFISLFPQLETCEIRSDYSSAMTSEMMEEDESCVVEAIDRTTYRHKRAGLCLSAGCNPPKRPFTPRVLGRKILFSRNSGSLRVAVVDHSLHTVRLRNFIRNLPPFETLESFYTRRREICLEDCEDIFEELSRGKWTDDRSSSGTFCSWDRAS